MTSPIIETNIERMLEDHLWPEIIGLEERIADLQKSIEVLSDRRLKLINIANSAHIQGPHEQRNIHAFVDSIDASKLCALLRVEL